MFARFLTGRHIIWWAALIGMLLAAPALNSAIVGDDYLHWAIFTGHASNPQPGSFFGLFTFSDGKLASNQALIDNGQLVWWTSPDLKISFWRPISEWSQWLDYTLWPDNYMLMHLHSMVLYGLMVVLVGKLYQALDTNRLHTGLATFMFSTSMLHSLAITWLACRNQQVAGVLLVLTVLAYHHWRQAPSMGRALLACASLTLALLSAEAGIQTMGYLVAYALFMDQGKSLFDRLKPLIPLMVIVIVWKLIHSKLGYGSFGSPGYMDPSSNPSGFITSLLLRLPALMAAQWFGATSMTFELLSRPVQVAWASIAAVLLLGMAWLLQVMGVWRTPLARFMGAGAVLSLVPACAGYPFDRLTLNADIGVNALLAVLFVQVWERRQQMVQGGQRAIKYVVYVLGFIHILVFPLAAAGQASIVTALSRSSELMVPRALPEPPADQKQYFLLLNSPSAEGGYYLGLIRQFYGLRNPEALWGIGPNNEATSITRVDDTTLRVAVATGFKSTITRDFRFQPFKPGDTVRMGAVNITVEAVNELNVPTIARFQFPDSLDNAHWRFFKWDVAGVSETRPPVVGATLDLPFYDLKDAGMKALDLYKKSQQ